MVQQLPLLSQHHIDVDLVNRQGLLLVFDYQIRNSLGNQKQNLLEAESRKATPLGLTSSTDSDL